MYVRVVAKGDHPAPRIDMAYYHGKRRNSYDALNPSEEESARALLETSSHQSHTPNRHLSHQRSHHSHNHPPKGRHTRQHHHHGEPTGGSHGQHIVIDKPDFDEGETCVDAALNTLQGKRAVVNPKFIIKTTETAGAVGINMYAYHESIGDRSTSILMLFTLFEIVFTLAFFGVTLLCWLANVPISGGAFWTAMLVLVVITFPLHIFYMLSELPKQSLYSHAYNNATNHPLIFAIIGYALVLVVIGYFSTTYPTGFFAVFEPDDLDPLLFMESIIHFNSCYLFSSVALLWIAGELFTALLWQRYPQRMLYPHRISNHGTALYFPESEHEGQLVELTPDGT